MAAAPVVLPSPVLPSSPAHCRRHRARCGIAATPPPTTSTSGRRWLFFSRRPGPRRPCRAAAVPPEHGLSQPQARAVDEYEAALGDAKDALYAALEGMNRGIFGMTSEKRSEIHALVELLESKNPTPEPTDKLQGKTMEGGWMLEAHLQHDFDTGEEEDKVGTERFHQLRRFLPDD